MLPRFLVIGAMKAGTTTLFHDLRRNPHIDLPEKEVGALTTDAVLRSHGAEQYASIYGHATRPRMLAGDVSTTYAMLPNIAGCARRAYSLLDPSARIIYIVRDPIARIISHHRHERQERMITDGIDDAVRRYGRFTAFSQYARQLEPWIGHFGRDQILVLRFEDYVASRNETIAEVCAFLAVPMAGDPIDEDVIHNQSDAKPEVRGVWRRLSSNVAYRHMVRPLMNPEVRARIRHAVLPRSVVPAERPSRSTVEYLVSELADDLAEQRRLGIGACSLTPEELLEHHTMRLT